MHNEPVSRTPISIIGGHTISVPDNLITEGDGIDNA
jgi:hypothetical protein